MLPRVSQIKCEEADYLLFSAGDLISNVLFHTGQWEPHLQAVSAMFYGSVQAPLVLDVGANIGAYSIPIAKKIQGIGGTVFAFEPQRIVYYQLCGNAVINGLENYFAFQQAVGEQEGMVEIPEIDYHRNANIGAFSLNDEYRKFHDIEASMKGATRPVPMVRLDSLKLERPVSLLKIDVEGHEEHVIRGATGLLEQSRFPPILFEAWEFDWYAKRKKQLFDCIEALGYRITPISPTDFIAQHDAYPVQADFDVRSDGAINMVRTR
jgi:FkbM family methyltransferase